MDMFPLYAGAALFLLLGVWQAGWPEAAATLGSRWMYRDREPNWSDTYLGFVRFGGVVLCLMGIGAVILGVALGHRAALAERCKVELKPALDAERSIEGWSPEAMQAFADAHDLELTTTSTSVDLPELPDYARLYGLDSDDLPSRVPTPLVTTTHTFSTGGTPIIAASVQTGGYEVSTLRSSYGPAPAKCMP